MDVTLNWKGRMTLEGTGPSGHQIRMDSDQSAGGDDSGVRPMELIALGLAGCTAMDVISILRKKQQAVADFRVNFHGSRAAEHPKVFTDSEIEYQVYGTDLDEAAILRAIELSAEKYCPAHAMLEKAFPIRLTYKIFDAETKALLKKGEYRKKMMVI